MIEIIDGTWAAGETKTFHINGEYIELLDAQYQCDVFLMDAAGAQISVMRKCEASFFSKPSGGFRTVQITSAQAQYIRFFVGSGDAGTRRISSTVQVVDGNRARSLAGASFSFRPNTVGAAGQFPVSQLWNPAGSGKRVIVDQLTLTASVATSILWAVNAVAAPTLAADQGVNLLGGGAAPATTQVRTDVPAALQALNWFGSVGVPANQTIVVNPRRPWVLPPGFGLYIQSAAANLTISGMGEFFEELI